MPTTTQITWYPLKMNEKPVLILKGMKGITVQGAVMTRTPESSLYMMDESYVEVHLHLFSQVPTQRHIDKWLELKNTHPSGWGPNVHGRFIGWYRSAKPQYGLAYVREGHFHAMASMNLRLIRLQELEPNFDFQPPVDKSPSKYPLVMPDRYHREPVI